MALRISRWLGLFVLSALTSLSGAGTAAAAAPDELRVMAATSLAPLAGELETALRRQGGRIRLTIAGGEAALTAVADGEAEAALLTRALDDNEATRFVGRIVGHDSLLLVVHERNPLDDISEAQVRAIFSREFSDWQQIGAGNAGAIVPVRRGLASATRRLFDRAFGIGNVMPVGAVELASNLATVLYVAADPQAIGYVSAGAYAQARQRGLRIKALRMAGQAPDARTCADGSAYRLCRPLLLVVRKETPARRTAALAAMLTGPLGEDLLIRHGFAPAAAR